METSPPGSWIPEERGPHHKHSAHRKETLCSICITLIQMMVIGYFLCLLFLSARQGQRGKNHNSGEGCAPSYWHSCILQSRPRYCPTVVGVSPIASTSLLLRTSRCHFALLTVYSTKGYTTSSRAPSSHSHLGICFRRVWLKSWYAVKLQNAISWTVCNSINRGMTQSTSLRGFTQGRRKKVPIRYLQKIL